MPHFFFIKIGFRCHTRRIRDFVSCRIGPFRRCFRRCLRVVRESRHRVLHRIMLGLPFAAPMMMSDGRPRSPRPWPYGLTLGLEPDASGRNSIRAPMRVLHVVRGSTADMAGVKRGWRLLAVERARDGVRVSLAEFASWGCTLGDVRCLFADSNGRRFQMQLSERGAASDMHVFGRRPWKAGRRSSCTSPRASVSPDRRPAVLLSSDDDRRIPPRRFASSLSPGSRLPSKGLFRSFSVSPPSNRGLFGAIVHLFTPQIESYEQGSEEAVVACRRAWRGWNDVHADDAVIMRKEFPSECVGRFRALRRKLRLVHLDALFDAWQNVVGIRRAELLCQLRVLSLRTRHLQEVVLSEWHLSTQKSSVTANAMSAGPGAESEAQLQNDRQRLVETDSSYHVPARPLHAPIGPSHQKTLQSNVSRQSWFFGLFSREPGSGADDAKAVQEADLVNAPSMPAHVGLRWPDLDLDSYIVRPPLADHATSAKEHLERRLASLIPKLMAASHDRARRLQTSSRRLKSLSAEVLITSKGLARDLLEENSLCPSLALAAFATQKLGAASAQQWQKQILKHVFKSWQIMKIQRRMHKVSADNFWRKKLGQKVRRTLLQWRRATKRACLVRKASRLLWLKRSSRHLRSFFTMWREAAGNGWNCLSDDGASGMQRTSPTVSSVRDHAAASDGVSTHIVQTSHNIGRVIFGERAVETGVAVVSSVGQFLLGSERFDAVVSQFSPPTSPHRAQRQPSLPLRAATESPQPTAREPSNSGISPTVAVALQSRALSEDRETRFAERGKQTRQPAKVQRDA